MIPSTSTTVPVEQLNSQRQAGAAAWTADEYAACERRASVREIVTQLRALGPGWSTEERQKFVLRGMRRTLKRQLTIHGLGYVALPDLPYDELGPLDGAR